MNNTDIAIKVEDISKCYRIGLKKKVHDNLAGAFFDFLKSPIDNFKKYRSLYNFEDLKSNQDSDSSDIIWALKNVSFDLKKGEVLGIIGRNGSGKSTLLKVLCRITPPTDGYAEVRGRVASLLEVGTGFHPELTGRENVYLNGAILGMKKKEMERKFNDIIEFSGIRQFIDTPVKRYSSGMRVRLAFAVAAHLEPEILIIDEVLAVGDADFQRKCLNKMQDVGEEGRTVLFVSHNLQAVTRLCTRAIRLDKGILVDDGPAHRVVSDYLKSKSDTSAEHIWRDPAGSPGGEIARLLAARVKTENGSVAESFDIRKPIAVEMEYEVFESGHVLLPHFHFFNEEGIFVFMSLDLDPNWRGRPRPAGRYVNTAWIPGNLLSEGLMYVSVVLLAINPNRIQFHEREVLSFQVVDSLDGESARGDWAHKVKGVVRPMLKWETQYSVQQ
jgi:lipopolysaccharide transport system ATP-binding protein